ncbi:hypothetical protein LOTGIDRAFT_222143 [Lottia gigantea]|uniref:AB hydrolase-1 domain-containing protein n=1 Tax=Lottia gigantea TaxID=225164 RepID=V3ZJ53_LOTGI|nr:hypothetical protein LOTGIDRAFT_222143 [Lottia gigantea]ESO84297.1 hypothetical protein LOTGIDRAFT_222143 [Lottia gigantea]
MVSTFVALILAIFIGIFICYPPPPLTKNLEKWQNEGDYVIYENKIIFYKVFSPDIPGKGEGSVLCLHGFPSSSYDWVKIVEDLKNNFKNVIVFDFLGFGFSEKPVSYNYTITEQADISLYLLQHLQVHKVHLLSHDYGDTVALEILARLKKNEIKGVTIKSLSMLNGGIFQDTHHPRFLQKVLLYPVLGRFLSKFVFYNIFSIGFSEVFGTNKPTADEMWEFWVCLRYKDGTGVLADVINFLPERKKYNERWVGALKSIDIPVQMIYGPADPVNPSPQFNQVFKKLVPQHKLVELDSKIGHYPQWEDPARVAAEFIKFVQSVPN